MNTTSKSLAAAGIVVACSVALIGGTIARDRTDMKATKAADFSLERLVALKSIDQDLAETDYFAEMTNLLKREYIDSISDEQKLASGAVRGMIASLGDTNCLFYDPELFVIQKRALSGEYEGIGAYFVLHVDDPKAKAALTQEASEEGSRSNPIPKLMVSFVVPGGPADRAGVKPGDWVDTVNGQWVINSRAIEEFREVQEKVQKKELPEQRLIDMRRDLREKVRRNMAPLGARDRLIKGTDGSLDIVWNRGSQQIKTTITKARSEVKPVEAKGDTVVVRFIPGAAEELRRAIDGRSALTIDLRNSGPGDFEVMQKCLEALAPSGEYGTIVTEHKEPKTIPFQISDGADKTPALTLLVDSTTRGAAEIFALALSSKGLAKLSGGEMAGDRSVVRHFELPDGSGYSLVTGKYQAARRSS
jgi:carboxyl-terminal processing protease